MYKRIIGVLILTLLLVACKDKERESTIDKITYDNGNVIVLFNDGMVITTHLYDDNMSEGDVVKVIHLTNGDIKIIK